MSKPAPGRSHRTGISLAELFRLFPDDAAAEEFFIRRRWPDGIACHYCGSLNVQTGCAHKTMPFRCRTCRKRFSVRTGTVMQSSKLGYHVWLVAMYLMTTSLKGVSSMKLHRDLGVTQKTAWHLAHRLREMWKRDGAGPFVGPVEADECYIGGKVGNMSNRRRKQFAGQKFANKTTVAGVRDRETKQVRVAVIEGETGPMVRGLVAGSTTAETKLYTDESAIYAHTGNHESVKHSAREYVRGEVHTNGMESFWSMLKRGYVGTFHRMSMEHLPRYVTEFEGRHNARDLDTAEQMAAMVRGAENRRLRYSDLIGWGVRARARAR